MNIDMHKNITMTRGDSESITVSCEQEPFAEGDKVTLTVRVSRDDTRKLMQKDVTTFPDGKALICIDPEDTSSLEFGTYIYDIQLTRSNGVVKTPVKGKFTVDLEVTYDD